MGWLTYDATGLTGWDGKSPRHPRAGSIRQKYDHYQQHLSFGVAAPCCGFEPLVPWRHLVTYVRVPMGLFGYSFCWHDPRPSAPIEPNFYAFEYPQNDYKPIGRQYRMFSRGWEFRRDIEQWSELPLFVFGNHDNLSAAAGPISIDTAQGEERWLSHMPQCHLATDTFVRSTVPDKGPPAAIQWPPLFYPWWTDEFAGVNGDD